MMYVGLDAHWRTSTVVILNEFGQQIKHKRIKGHWDKVVTFLAGLDQPFQVAYEASCGYGYLYDALSRIARRVVVAHPGQLRLIFRAKRKNDRVDATKLAKLLYLNEVPPAYVPSRDVRQWRAMIEYRQRLVGKVASCKNSLRALLRGLGVVAPRSLWTQAGLAWLGEQDLAMIHALRRDLLLDELQLYRRQLAQVTKVLNRIGQQSPAVTLLQTIPGIGPRTAEAIVAYAADAKRFASNRAFGAYLGLVPCQDASAGSNRLGHITREGPATARKLLVEASWQVIRRCRQTRARFERLCRGRRDRRKIALVATARHLACVMLSMLRTGEVWRAAA